MTLYSSEAPASTRDRLWQDSRNSLGIARLLAHEGRPEPLLATACRTAVEAACRAALEQAGAAFDGDLGRAFERLALPDDLLASIESAQGRARLQAAEKAVGWLADHLRIEAPEKSWGY
jgi:hypothetical protein